MNPKDTPGTGGLELAHEEAKKILDTHRPIPLEEEAASKIQSIIEEVEERIKKGDI